MTVNTHLRTRRTRCRFAMAEVIAGALLLGILAATFFEGLHGLRQAERRVTAETAAVHVLGNVLERLRAEPVVTVPVVHALLEQEFAAAAPWPSAARAACVPRDDGLRLAVAAAEGHRPFAHVTLPWQATPGGSAEEPHAGTRANE